jgi:hypothetical protein
VLVRFLSIETGIISVENSRKRVKRWESEVNSLNMCNNRRKLHERPWSFIVIYIYLIAM